MLNQPDWLHFKEEKGDTYSKTSLHKEAAEGADLPMSTLPVYLK